MESNTIREALFKRGFVTCKACHSQIPRKNVSFRDDDSKKRLRVQIRCTNPRCRLFNQAAEFCVPTDQFVL